VVLPWSTWAIMAIFLILGDIMLPQNLIQILHSHLQRAAH